MASYLRSLFSSGQPTPSHGKAKSRSRTHSTPAPSPYYVYTSAPGNTPSTSTTSGTSLSKVQRANSNKTPVMVSSPLRYPTYDSRHSHDDSRPSPNRAANHQPPPDTMNGPYHPIPLTHISPSVAHNHPSPEHTGRPAHFPQSGYVTPGSSRSNSSSSLYPGPVYGSTPFVPSPLVPSPPRSQTSSDDTPAKPTGHKISWQVGVSSSASGSSTYGPEPSPSRSQARAPRFHMHPLISYTRLHHAPISYDVAFTPSARTVVDRTMHSPLPAVTLAQPATEPPIPASSRLVLRSPKLPWVVVVGPIGSPQREESQQRKTKTTLALTNLDVLYAVHATLMKCVTPEEWHSLGEGSRAQRRVAEAYKKRCTRMGGGWDGGVRRVDWLGSKTHLVGVEIDKNNEGDENVGTLIFGKPE